MSRPAHVSPWAWEQAEVLVRRVRAADQDLAEVADRTHVDSKERAAARRTIRRRLRANLAEYLDTADGRAVEHAAAEALTELQAATDRLIRVRSLGLTRVQLREAIEHLDATGGPPEVRRLLRGVWEVG